MLDQIAAHYASTGAEVMLVLLGQPAAFSSDCSGSCTGRMKPGEGCVCGTPGDGFAHYPPHSYSPEWNAHWKCVLRHYAELGVRRFEIWNEPDVPSFFRADEAAFIEMFEEMRLALEGARDELDPATAAEIEIGGPAMSQVAGVVGGTSGPPSFVPLLNAVAAGAGDADLDFVSMHYYTGDPGFPFAADEIGVLRSFLPPAWGPVRLDIDEWNIGLGLQHPCQDADGDPTNGWQAPPAGQDPSAGCDHRGAGYAAYMLAGFASAPDDVYPYVFEPLANAFSERCDMLESSLGLFTKHGLPKPMAAVHWAASQMDWRSLGAAQDIFGDRSLGWFASVDRDETVHFLAGQFDSEPRDHFARHYASRGHDPASLIGACGCGGAPNPSGCVDDKIALAQSDPDPVARLQAECPGLDATEASDALAAAEEAARRAGLEGTPVTLGLEVRGLACRRKFRVDVFTTGPGQSTADVWRAMDGPHRTAPQCNAAVSGQIDAYPYDWERIQDDLWDVIRTPTATYEVRKGESVPLLTVPAYGSVYVRVYH